MNKIRSKKYLIIILILIFWVFSFSYSQNISNSFQSQCNTWYQIQWLENIKINQISQYSLIKLQWSYNSWLKISYKLMKGDKKIDEFKWEDYTYNFKTDWKYSLEVKIVDWKCEYTIQKEINVYKKLILYIWTKLDEFDLWFDENFKKHSILFYKIILSDKKFFFEDEAFSKISENINYFKESDYLVLNNSNFDQIFQIVSNISKTQKLDLDKKSIFVSTDVNQNFMKRLLAKYVKTLFIDKIYILNNDYFLQFFWDISFDKDITSQKYIKPFQISFSNVPKYYIVSYFIDNLISNWFPVTLLWLFLVLALSALVISIFRQMIWFSIFGIYSPLLFAIAMSVLWIKFSLISFLIAFISTVFTRFFTKKIYLLYSAKTSILIIVYFIITILFLGFDKLSWLNIIDFQIFNNTLIIFPIMYLILVWDKVFPEWFKFFSKWRIFSFIEFFIVSIVIYFLIWWNNLNYFLLSYPEIIILILWVNVLVWRFTWLQLLEYFRFIPLLKKWDEEE